MGKRKGQSVNTPSTGNTDASNAVVASTPDASKVVEVVAPKSMIEINAVMAAMSDTEKAALKALQVPAHTLAGTTGLYRAKDGKGTTKDKSEAKLAVNGKPIPAYTHARPAVNGVSATHADETEQLRGRYAQGWGQQVIARCKARAEKLGRSLTAAERDKEVNQSDVPAAWRPRYNKDQSPASQYARHIAVMVENDIKVS